MGETRNGMRSLSAAIVKLKRELREVRARSFGANSFTRGTRCGDTASRSLFRFLRLRRGIAGAGLCHIASGGLRNFGEKPPAGGGARLRDGNIPSGRELVTMLDQDRKSTRLNS